MVKVSVPFETALISDGDVSTLDFSVLHLSVLRQVRGSRHSLGVKDEVIPFWGSKVKGHRDIFAL